MTESALVTFEQKVLPPDSPIGQGALRSTRQRYAYPNGSEIIVAGLTANSRDNRAKVMSTEYDMIVVLEATELAEDDWEKLISRLRNGVMPYQQILGDCNPDAPTHWLHQRCDKGIAKVYFSRHSDNPSLTKDYLDKLGRLTGVRRIRYFEGKRAASEGAVYQFDRALHLISRGELFSRGLILSTDGRIPVLNRNVVKAVGVGVDWGYTNPGAFVVGALDGDGRLYIVHEVYQSRKLMDWWVPQAKRVKSHFGVTAFVPDPAEPAFIEEFRRAGMPMSEADNDIEAGIQAVSQRLQPAGDGKPRLYLYDDALYARDEELAESKHPVCIEQEFDAYCYPKAQDGKPIKETPVDMYNHSLDALRYLVQWADKRGRGGAIEYPAPECRNVVSTMPRGVFRE
jgi:phage terminase large subunit